MCKQVECQKFGDYITELHHKSQETELENFTYNLIQHVLICGIEDSKLREHLLMQPNLTFDKAIQAGQKY